MAMAPPKVARSECFTTLGKNISQSVVNAADSRKPRQVLTE
jgi:hypothetical protein